MDLETQTTSLRRYDTVSDKKGIKRENHNIRQESK